MGRGGSPSRRAPATCICRNSSLLRPRAAAARGALSWLAGPCRGRWGPARFCAAPRAVRAPRADGANGDHPVIGADAHAQRIAGPNEFGRFGARAVELHLAAGYRLSGKAARFEETRGPEPPIQPDGIGGG